MGVLEHPSGKVPKTFFHVDFTGPDRKSSAERLRYWVAVKELNFLVTILWIYSK